MAYDSSQDEYEESSSESDAVMTSSNEALLSGSSASLANGSDNELDADAPVFEPSATVITTSHEAWTPQPNSFSHPSSTSTLARSGTAAATVIAPRDSYFPFISANVSQRAPVQPAAPRHSRTDPPPRAHAAVLGQPSISPSPSPHYPVDTDAALRASLHTLLSCAAAARDRGHKPAAPSHRSAGERGAAHIEPATLRLIPEATLLRGATSTSSGSTVATSAHSDSEGGTAAAIDGAKRKAGHSSSSGRGSGGSGREQQQRHSPARAAKKLRASVAGLSDADAAAPVVSPTMLTWAAALVVVGALGIGFSAGYVAGRQGGGGSVGGGVRVEGVGARRACGGEVVARGLGVGGKLRLGMAS